MPAVLGQNNCQYTNLAATGTSTINALQGSSPAATGPAGVEVGVLYGCQGISAGTSFVINCVDIYVAGTTTTTTTIMNGTAAANTTMYPGPPGLGVRYKGSLVAIVTGTAGSMNLLWD